MNLNHTEVELISSFWGFDNSIGITDSDYLLNL